MKLRLHPEQMVGLTLVVALHAAAFWALWQQGLLPTVEQVQTLFVSFTQPPPPVQKPEPPKPLPQPVKPRPVEKPQPQQLVAQAPVQAPTEYVAPPPPPQPVVTEAPPVAKAAVVAAAVPALVKPLVMESELSVACPNREPPVYPAVSRRRGETGTVILKVELDERGHVADARVQSSSGQARLDEAALSAVRNWRCTPPQRNGQAVRAIALQPFNFVLQGN